MCVCFESYQEEGSKKWRNSVKLVRINNFISGIIPSIVVFIIEALISPLMEFVRKLGISKSKKLIVEIEIGVVFVMGFSSETNP